MNPWLKRSVTTPHKLPIRIKKGYGSSCPHCGEEEITNSIHKRLTYKCGYSSDGNKVVMTHCLGDHFTKHYEVEEVETFT